MQTGQQPHLGLDPPNAYMRGLVAWVSRVTKRPILTLFVVGVATLGAAGYAADNIRLNSDNARLVRQDAQFRQDYQELLESFPQFRDTTLVVLSGKSMDVVSDAQQLLADTLRKRTGLISYLYAPGADPFFEDHAFLYLEEAELETVITRLARSQPALTALVLDPSLRGLFGELELGIENVKTVGEAPLGMIRMSNRLSDIGEGMLAGRPVALSWSAEFFGSEETVYRLIILQGREDFDQATPAEELITEIRSTAEELRLTPENGVRVRLTGRVPLAHEELTTMRSGLVVAGSLSAVLLALILGYGLRSLRIVVATVITLLVSLVWTTAYAMATVGEFNTISAAFGVLLMGLGVDFGIHFGLRYEEEAYRGLPVSDALAGAAAGTGGAISLCALTSAIGFASFIPTRFTGLAELGAIAAGGMLFSLIASYTVSPAVRSQGRWTLFALAELDRATRGAHRHDRMLHRHCCDDPGLSIRGFRLQHVGDEGSRRRGNDDSSRAAGARYCDGLCAHHARPGLGGCRGAGRQTRRTGRSRGDACAIVLRSRQSGSQAQHARGC